MQIQYELLKHRQSEYLKAIYETRGKQRIHGKSLLTKCYLDDSIEQINV